MERIKQRRQQLKMRQIDLAKAVNVSQSTISDYETGRYDPDFETLAKIAQELQVSVGWLLSEYDVNHPNDKNYRALMKACREHYVTDQLEDFLYKHQLVSVAATRIPVLGEVVAGIPIEAIQNIVDYEEIDAALADTGDFFGLRLKGDSMEPRMREGDVVIIRKQEDADTGDVVVVLINGDSATVKRIKKEPSGISLIPNNPSYDVLYYSNEEIQRLPVQIIGKVVELRAKF